MAHSVTAALVHLLTAAGAVAPHTGQPYSEALLLGLGGGIGAGCVTFDFAGRPCRRLGFRHRWEDDLRFVRDAAGRLGIEPVILEAHGPAGADKCLDRLLAQGLPVMAWADQPELAGEVLVVLGQEGDNLLLRADAMAIRIPRVALAAARNARPSHKNRLLAIPTLPGAVDLSKAVTQALAACVERLLRPPVPELGLNAIRLLQPAPELAAAIERDTDGAAFRHLFAAFLDEAADVTGRRDLHDCADQYRALASMWNRLAEGCRTGSAAEWLGPLAEAELTAARHLQALLPVAHTQ